MPRTIRDSKLETRAARDRLKPSKKPYWKTVVPGALALGYRRKKKDLPGSWIVRRYIGQERYRIAPLGLADDFQDVGEGTRVMNFADAQKAALAHKEAPRGVLTVAVAIADYVAWLKVHRATGEDAEARAAKHILPTLGQIKVTDLTTVRLNNWRDVLAEAGALARTKKGEKQKYRKAPATADEKRARRATANRTITILKGALNKAFNDGLVSEDLEWRRFKPFENVNAARPGYLTIAEAKRLINAADPATGFRDLVHAALQTGARYGELCALKVRDFHRGKLAIHQSKSGKPRDIVLSDEGVAFFEQLTAGRDPQAVMLRNLGRVARALEQERELLRKQGKPDKDAKIEDDGRWLKSEQSRPMAEACKPAKIKPAIGFHALRHSWASHAVMNGVPLMVVARNLGHASTAMVERHYGHLAESYIDDEIRKGAPQFGAVTTTNVKVMR